MLSSRNADTPAKKMSRLYVEPAELARKLAKELEGNKVLRSGRAFVLNQYTVFLCREDYARFRSHVDQLVAKLQNHLEKIVQAKGYGTTGALSVELAMDPDLKPGYFGVLAERAMPSAGPRPSSAPAASGGGLRDESAPAASSGGLWGDSGEDDYPSGHLPGNDSLPARPLSVPPLPVTPGQGVPMAGTAVPMPPLPGPSMAVPPLPAPSIPAHPSYARPLSEQPASELPRSERAAHSVEPQPQPQPQPQPTPSLPPVATGVGQVDESTGGTPRRDVSQMGQGNETIVLKVNNQQYAFDQGRVMVGRSRDVDFRIDHADVSRRHAVIYWSEGSIVVKDLGSTNGTMVNGYPVESTVVRPSDVIRIGDCHITVEPR